jgi:hypothetical protein
MKERPEPDRYTLPKYCIAFLRDTCAGDCVTYATVALHLGTA